MIRPRTAVELFAAGNLAFLAVDVYIAHLVNAFERPEEWIPVVLSVAGPVLLAAGWAAKRDWPGLVAGWASVAVGVAGMVFHLESHFFEEQTIRNLVYTAPFVAPLAYAGIGLLLILDRSVDAASLEWAQWVLFLALGGFAGNFVLSLADHAQNGFFNRGEWIPVAASALACAFLLMIVVRPLDAPLLRATAWILALQTLTGVAGFALHVRANMSRPGETLMARFIYGAPVFAPLLFANLALLAAIGLWGVHVSRTASR